MILTYEAGGSLVSIEFDATIREEHQSATTVTEYHVETGSNVADHARPENDRITVDVVVTNTPIVAPTTNNDGVRGQVSPVGIEVKTISHIPKILPGIGLLETLLPETSTTVNFDVLNFDGQMDRVRSVYNELTLLASSTTLVNLSSPIREYTNMVLRTVTTPRGPQDGSSITFTFTATAVRFVDSEIVTVKASAHKKTSKGVKKPSTTQEPLRSTGKAAAIKAGLATATPRPLAP